ncbi:MAG: HDOD domain-containing protein [Rhodocyclaceae bacterium]|nr:MAG: HDOD domain-containing protein [Rhodocyclaceae bacterium]
MTKLKPEQVLACLQALPALPAVVTELLTSFDNEDVDIAELTRRIACDQALAARLLRVANSSFYGLQTRVSTINEALVVLGFRAVRSMVIAMGVSGAFRAGQCHGFEVQPHIRHGIGVGLAARALALETRHNPEIAFTGGILHDIGKLVLASCFAAQYSQALAYREQHDCLLVVAERDVLGMDHAEVGGLLADAWHFPPALRAALADHHGPAAATAASPADLIHVADAIAHGLGLAESTGEMVMPVDQTAWQRLGVDAEKIARVLPQVVDGMDEACAVFSG